MGRVSWAVFGYLTIHTPVLAPFNCFAKKKKKEEEEKEDEDEEEEEKIRNKEGQGPTNDCRNIARIQPHWGLPLVGVGTTYS